MEKMIDQALKSPMDIDRREDPGIFPDPIPGDAFLCNLQRI
jgi:hypothetical protein